MQKIILEDFSYSDIIEIINKDKAFIQHQLVDLEASYRKIVAERKPTDAHHFAPKHIVSNRGLNYVITFFFWSKEDFRSNGFTYTIYAYQLKKDGFYAFFYVSDHDTSKDCWMVYTPHFFNRYRERFLKDMSMEKSEVMNQFFLRNYRTMNYDQDNPDYPNGTMSLSQDGIGLGVRNEDTYAEIKTFISLEMLKGDQVGMSEKTRKKLHQIEEDVKKCGFYSHLFNL